MTAVVVTTESWRTSQQLGETRTIAVPAPLELPSISAAPLSETPNATEAVAQQAEDDEPVPYSEVFYLPPGELPGGRWLRGALPVHVRLEGAEFVARQPHLGVFAFGETSIIAVMNLVDEIADHHATLEAAGERLAPRLVRQRDLFRHLISAADA